MLTKFAEPSLLCRNLTMPDTATKPLFDLKPGQTANIQHVNNQDWSLLRYLRGNGLTPGASVTVSDHTPYDETLYIQVNKQKKHLVIGVGITRKVFVYA
jgi:Fe2+ transport system protein FeoA